MSGIVTFLPSGKQVQTKDGQTLLDAAISAGLRVDAPCGGQGTCGKCVVEVLEGAVLGTQRACRTAAEGKMTVMLPQQGKTEVLCAGENLGGKLTETSVRAIKVHTEPCSFGENRSDWSRFCASASAQLGIKEEKIPFKLSESRKLFGLLEKTEGNPWAVFCENRLLELCGSQTRPLTAAFDIGTTTVVCYLLDARTGKQLAAQDMLNPQTAYGADVVSRALYALNENMQPLTDCVRSAMNELIEKTTALAGADKEQIYRVAVAGNTCMHHLFAAIPPASLVSAPYYAAVNDAFCMTAQQSGLSVNPNAEVWMLPNLAGFVGADTCAVMLAVGFDQIEDLTLVVDIGTNGEMVLGNKQKRVACSTAAGPALEGAKIRFGMRAAPGAIDRVWIEGDRLCVRTIDRAPAKGICGSGLIDAVACLVKLGVVQKNGRFAKKMPESLAGRFIEFEGGKAFLLTDPSDSANSTPICITQKDIREIQLAKGAISAGVRLMCDTMGVQVDGIRQVLLAGAFGSYIDPDNACIIGLLPPELNGKITAVGNAAGEGAKLVSLSETQLERCAKIAGETRFLELATHPNFQNMFIHQLDF